MRGGPGDRHKGEERDGDTSSLAAASLASKATERDLILLGGCPQQQALAPSVRSYTHFIQEKTRLSTVYMAIVTLYITDDAMCHILAHPKPLLCLLILDIAFLFFLNIKRWPPPPLIFKADLRARKVN